MKKKLLLYARFFLVGVFGMACVIFGLIGVFKILTCLEIYAAIACFYITKVMYKYD